MTTVDPLLLWFREHPPPSSDVSFILNTLLSDEVRGTRSCVPILPLRARFLGQSPFQTVSQRLHAAACLSAGLGHGLALRNIIDSTSYKVNTVRPCTTPLADAFPACRPNCAACGSLTTELDVSPLYIASHCGKVDTVRLLLDAGARPNLNVVRRRLGRLKREAVCHVVSVLYPGMCLRCAASRGRARPYRGRVVDHRPLPPARSAAKGAFIAIVFQIVTRMLWRLCRSLCSCGRR